MKKPVKVIAIVALICLLALSAVGCKKGIVSNETYYLYEYDSAGEKFVKKGSSLTFGENFETFEYAFGDGDITITGKATRTEVPDAFSVTCNEEAISLVAERYKENLIRSGASEETIEMYTALVENFTPSAQYFVYEDKLFMADAVEFFREAGEGADAFEGVYLLGDSEEKVKLRGGTMYGADEDGEYVKKAGYYTVSRGILTITSVNEDGSDHYENGVLYRKRYLMAKVKIPAEGNLQGTSFDEQLESSAFSTKINAQLSDYSEKTVAVLVGRFFCKEIK